MVLPAVTGDPTEHSWRRGAGIVLILLLIILWAGLIAQFAPAVGRWPVFVQAMFYLFVGIAWVIPLKPLIRWMQTGRFRAPRAPD